MTRNRTAIESIHAVGAQMMLLLLAVLATGLAVIQYFSLARDRMRGIEVKLRKRAARRVAA
jgi:hypothetical protein